MGIFVLNHTLIAVKPTPSPSTCLSHTHLLAAASAPCRHCVHPLNSKSKIEIKLEQTLREAILIKYERKCLSFAWVGSENQPTPGKRSCRGAQRCSPCLLAMPHHHFARICWWLWEWVKVWLGELYATLVYVCICVCVVSVHCGKWRAHTPREGNKFNKCCLFILIKSSCNSSTDIDKITLQRALQQEAAGNGAGKRLLISGELWRRACVDLGIFRRLFVAYPCKGQRVKRHFKHRFLNSVCHVLRFEESLFSKLFSRNQPKTRYNTLQNKLTFKLENFRDNFSTSRMEFSSVGKVAFLKIHL